MCVLFVVFVVVVYPPFFCFSFFLVLSALGLLLPLVWVVSSAAVDTDEDGAGENDGDDCCSTVCVSSSFSPPLGLAALRL